VSFTNPDGTDRQSILGRCRVGEHLTLVPEPENPRDPNAIRVQRASGEQLGYIRADLAKSLSPVLASDGKTLAILAQRTGGSWPKPTKGANILVVHARPGVSQEEFDQYVSEALGRGCRAAAGRAIPDQESPGRHGPAPVTSGMSCGGCLGMILLGVLSLMVIGSITSRRSPPVPPAVPGPGDRRGDPPLDAVYPEPRDASELPLRLRQAIYADMHRAYVLAIREADERVDLGGQPETKASIARKLAEQERILKEASTRNRAAVAEKYGIDIETARAIDREGVRNRWPEPDVPPARR